MRRRMLAIVGMVWSALLAAGCSGSSEAQPETEKPPVAVEVTAAASADLVQAIEVTGSLEPKFAADVKTQIPGLIREVYVTEWVPVRKGQPLARIDIAETEALARRAEAALATARAALSQAEVAKGRAERERERTLRLKEAGLATQQGVDDADTEAAAATARVEAARAQLQAAEEEVAHSRARLGKGLVVAPMNGIVALRAVNVGDLASDAAGARPIFRIVDNRLLNLTVTVPSVDSARVRVGQPLEFTVDALPDRTFTGTVMYLNPELSAADRSLKVVAEVRNDPETLRGGLFAKGRIVTGKRHVLQIPRQALLRWDLDAATGEVFVVTGGTAKRRQVSTGALAGDQVEIVAGLAPGEGYVTRGGFTLKDGDRVAVAVAAKN